VSKPKYKKPMFPGSKRPKRTKSQMFRKNLDPGEEGSLGQKLEETREELDKKIKNKKSELEKLSKKDGPKLSPAAMKAVEDIINYYKLMRKTKKTKKTKKDGE
jgi:hypothetical protein